MRSTRTRSTGTGRPQLGGGPAQNPRLTMLGSGRLTRREFIRRGAGAAVVAGFGMGGLAACGGEERGGTGGASQEPVTIEYWHINNETLGGPALQELVGRFNERGGSVTVRERFHGEESTTSLLEDLQTSLAAGNEPPDVAQIGYDQLNYVANNFEFVPAEELAQRYGPDDYFSAFPNNLLKLGQADGRQVGVPYGLSEPILFCNADLLLEAGLDPGDLPRTWDSWKGALRTAREGLGRAGMCFRTTPGQVYWTQAIVGSAGGTMLGCQDGQAVASFDGADAVGAMGSWAELFEEELALYLIVEQAEQAFVGGEAAVIATYSSLLEGLREQSDFEFRSVPFPRFGDRPPVLPGAGADLFVFSKDEARQEAAWEWVRFLLSPENLQLYTEATGFLPTRDGVEVPEDPVRRVPVDQLPYVEPWFSFPGPNGLQAAQELYDAQEAIAKGQTEPREAMERAAADVDGLIEGQPCV